MSEQEKIKYIEIEGARIPMKKDFLGWRVVHPIKNEDGTRNYVNLIFGGYRNLIVLVIYLIIAASTIYGVNEMMASCKNMANNPCDYFGTLNCMNQRYDLNPDMVEARESLRMIPNISLIK